MSAQNLKTGRLGNHYNSSQWQDRAVHLTLGYSQSGEVTCPQSVNKYRCRVFHPTE